MLLFFQPFIKPGCLPVTFQQPSVGQKTDRGWQQCFPSPTHHPHPHKSCELFLKFLPAAFLMKGFLMASLGGAIAQSLFIQVCPASTLNWPIKPSQEQDIPVWRPVRNQGHPGLSQHTWHQGASHISPHQQFFSQESKQNTRSMSPVFDNNEEAMAQSERAGFVSDVNKVIIK